ncbi:hypothetical protein [Streptomyces sp. NPDC020983]|uniref:hypothetical protein n=1 Tax=Streptomyces sp. NPDC020983 TaxID=3365106 RepID=UPI00378EB2EC
MTAAPGAHEDDTPEPEAMNRHHTSDPDPARSALPGRAPAAASRLDAGAGADAVRETDEEALRDLFRQAVRDLRPCPDALEHLRRAVPARRLHRRQAVAGSVAALLLVGAAVPALVHAAAGHGSPAAAPAGPGGTSSAERDRGGRADAWGTSGGAGATSPGQDDGAGSQAAASGGDGDSAGVATSPGSPPPPAAPACSSSQLGRGSSGAVPDPDGHVHGWFRVANVSTSACTVPPGPATVGVIAQGGADPAQITVVNHTAGDAAVELPAPSDDDQPLVLAPGETYQVAFAWVPADTGPGGCPPSGPPTASPTASPTPTDTGAPADGTDGAAAAAAAWSDNPQAGGPSVGSPPATTAPATIALTHTPAAGAPLVVGPTLQDACAGTVYTTAPVAEKAPDGSS